MITIGSMFAGIGGICLVFKSAGCRIVWANEINRAICKTYRLNIGDKYFVQSDIKDVDAKILPRFDILTVGFLSTYKFLSISEKQIYKQIGNAVGVPVVQWIAEKMLGALTD